MILHNNYSPLAEVLPEGTPVAIRDLRSGNTFQYAGLKGVYTIYSTDPIKIKRPDGWLVRCGDECKVVYQCSISVTQTNLFNI